MGLKILSWDDMEEIAEANPLENFWGQYMRANTFNILVGSPKAGKSSFTRDLISCALAGNDFLGQKMKHCERVLYITTEEDASMIRKEMKFMVGVDVLKKGFFLSPESPDSFIEFLNNLKDDLRDNPSIEFLVLDTLIDFIPGTNVDSPAELKPILMQFVKLCQEFKVTILGLHHDNRHGKTLLDKVSGSRAFTGTADTILGIHGSGNSKRSLESIGRCESKIPRTRLNFDEITRKFSLGAPSKSKANADGTAVEASEPLTINVIGAVSENPGITHKELMLLLDGSTTGKIKEIKRMVTEGFITRSGEGLKGKPFTYTAVGFPAVHAPVLVAAPVASAPVSSISLDDQILILGAKIRAEKDSGLKAELIAERAALQTKKRAAA